MKKVIKVFLTVFLLVLSGCDMAPQNGEKASLEVHFVDVGQADCAVLISDGDTMLIDGGNREDSSLVYSYLRDLKIDHLDYVIGTHAHEDHMGGLAGALNKATVGKIYVPEADSDAKFYTDFIEKARKENIEVDVPEESESIKLGDCDVTLFAPQDADEEELNNTSIVAKVVCGEMSFLFTGDAERDEEEEILKKGFDISATVLKSPHHGSETSSSYPFLREVMPEFIVISVGEDNPYGHPHKEVLERYRDLGAIVYRTDESGHIVMKTDGENLIVQPKKMTNQTAISQKVEDMNYSYIGNMASKKLHLPSCGNLPKEENRVYFVSREAAVSSGFSPCQGCKP